MSFLTSTAAVSLLDPTFRSCTARSVPVSSCDGCDEEPGLHGLEPRDPGQQLSSGFGLRQPPASADKVVNISRHFSFFPVLDSEKSDMHVCSHDFQANRCIFILLKQQSFHKWCVAGAKPTTVFAAAPGSHQQMARKYFCLYSGWIIDQSGVYCWVPRCFIARSPQHQGCLSLDLSHKHGAGDLSETSCSQPPPHSTNSLPSSARLGSCHHLRVLVGEPAGSGHMLHDTFFFFYLNWLFPGFSIFTLYLLRGNCSIRP